MGEYREVGPGVRQRLIHCDPGIVIVETLLDQGSVVPRHSHESGQVTVVVEGLLTLGSEAWGERTLRPGDYTVIPPGVAHWARALAPTLVLDVFWPATRDRRELAEKLGGKCA